MNTKEKVFQVLFNEKNYISGDDLAERLDLSRTSIWKAVKSLEKDGLLIDSIKGRGYKLIAGDLLSAQQILSSCPKLSQVKIIEESSSTQVDAKNDLSKNCLYLANFQGDARGRFSRHFYTERGRGIYMSLVLKPQVKFADMPQYTILTAAAVVTAIKKLTGIDVEIKWVNDIYLNNEKLAGIITEAQTDIETGIVTDIIIGIGLNFAIQDFPQDLNKPTTSLFKKDAPISRNDLISEIWNQFFDLMNKDYLKIYKEHSLVLGHQVEFKQNNINYTGLARDLTDTGELIVDTDQEGEKIISSGEISLSKW